MNKNLFIGYLLLFLPLLFTSCGASKLAKQEQIEQQEQQNMETVRIWYEEGWNNKMYNQLLDRCIAPDWVDGNPLLPDQTMGHAGILNLVETYLIAFHETQFKITHLFADGDHVAVRYEVTAVHEGEFLGIPPSGNTLTSTGIVIYRMENGKIKTSWSELDLMGVFNQIR